MTTDDLVRRLARELALPLERCEPHPCRAGELFHVQLGGRGFALKLYEEGADNDLYFFRAVAGMGVPVPAVHAFDEHAARPWVLMDWVLGSPRITEPYRVGRQLGALVRQVHGLAVDGAGRRAGGRWEFADWHELVEAQTERERDQIDGFDDSERNKATYRDIVDRFAALGRRQSRQPFLLHGDLGLDNLVVDDDRVVAMIDTGWCIGGCPLMDVAYFLNSPLGRDDGARGFLDGYGGVSLDELVALRLYLYVGKLGYFSATGNCAKYAQRRQSLLELAARR